MRPGGFGTRRARARLTECARVRRNAGEDVGSLEALRGSSASPRQNGARHVVYPGKRWTSRLVRRRLPWPGAEMRPQQTARCLFGLPLSAMRHAPLCAPLPMQLRGLHSSRGCLSPSSSSSPPGILHALQERGMVAQMTSKHIEEHLAQPRTLYLGFDPTADSLHVGNLLALIGLIHFQSAGHHVIALIGGATGAVGDPSGRTSERQALAPAVLAANVAGITAQLNRLTARGTRVAQEKRDTCDESRDSASEAQKPVFGTLRVCNNNDWLGQLSLVDFLGSVGKVSRMGAMLARDSVKSRLDSPSGMSFTEFSYQLLQAYDFYILNREHACTVQLGGSDQMGNISAGVDLIRRLSQTDAFGYTLPLLTTSNGQKFGKSAGNALWLDPVKTSPYELYQYFLRTPDEDVGRYLKMLTFLPLPRIADIVREHEADPSQRKAQTALAEEVTLFLHEDVGLNQARAATQLFFTKDLSSLKDTSGLIKGLAGSEEIPSMLTKIPRSSVTTVLSLVLASGILPSKSQIVKNVKSGALQLNSTKISENQLDAQSSDFLLNNHFAFIKCGKKNHKIVVLE